MVWNKLPDDQRIKAICEAWAAAEFPEETRWTPTTGNRPQTPRNGPVVI
jgi:hypothetical protein